MAQIKAREGETAMLLASAITTRVTVCTMFLAVQTVFAAADPVCDSLAKSPRGLYIRQSDGTVRDLKNPVPFDAGARLYYVTGEAPIGPNKEAVWHIRSQTISRSEGTSDRAFVYRPAVRTMCRNGKPAAKADGDFFDEFQPAERVIQLDRYIDYHSKTEADQRADFGLKTYFHFQVSNPGNGSCFRTDDFAAVGSLHDVYGFSDVARIPNRLTRLVSIVSTARAAARSLRYSGLSSEFAYLSGPAPSCFSFNMPVSTKSTEWSFFGSAAAAGWQPDATEIVIRQLPRGGATKLTIVWQP
jgi:hypothetical protein